MTTDKEIKLPYHLEDQGGDELRVQRFGKVTQLRVTQREPSVVTVHGERWH